MPASARTRRDERTYVTARPRNDAYTVLLVISLCAMIAGNVLLYLDYSRYPDKKPDQPPRVTGIEPAAGGQGTPAGQPGR